MAERTSTGSHDTLRAKLAGLREGSEGSLNVSDDTLVLFYKFLINDKVPDNLSIHWFCSQADDLTREAAVFLIRLHAYNSPHVQNWRKRLQSCLAKCTNCVQAYQEAKVTSRYTYFSAFSDEILQVFYKNLHEWELGIILQALKEDSLALGNQHRSLSHASPAVVFHMLSRLSFVQDDRILDIIRKNVPTTPFSSWPTNALPVGLLFLLVDESTEVRSWANRQIVTCTTTPMSSEQFLPEYAEAVEVVSKAVSECADQKPTQFCRDPLPLWAGYSVILRYVPPSRLVAHSSQGLDPRHVVMRHLSDTANHFLEVLKAFLIILLRLGPDVWKNEGEEYPQVIFSTIKDNPCYSEALQSQSDRHWLLQWIESYVKAVENQLCFSTVIPLMLQYLCEELQNERYGDVRPAAMHIALKLFHEVLSNEDSMPWDCVQRVKESLDIHAGIIVSVSFSETYGDEPWSESRFAARTLIKWVLGADVRSIIATILRLSASASSITVPNLQYQIWNKLYERIPPNDANGLTIIFEALSPIAHVDILMDVAYADLIRKCSDPNVAQKALNAVNHALTTLRQGFSDTVSRCLDFSNSEAMLNLLRQPNVVRHVLSLMFSPLEAMREPAQGVVGLAWDVETRSDCLRALISHFPTPAMSGMCRYLETFSKYAEKVPEACSVSKALARCFTDIIDVLCSSPDGLLLKMDFLKGMGEPGPAVELPRWWSLMARAISVIFQRTPLWAEFYSNDEMVLWMRDALIFGRDMLAQRRVIESAALALSSQPSGTSRKISRIGKKMVEDLQKVLLQFTKWLRLTDEELLYQAFALLQSLLVCFKETSIYPLKEALRKLQKHVDDAKRKDPAKPQTRLDATRLARLQEALSDFDDEVQIIEPPIILEKSKEHRTLINGATTAVSSKATKVKTYEQKSIRPERLSKTKKPRIDSYFTSNDQKKLDGASGLHQFSKVTNPVASISSTSAKASTPVLVPDIKIPSGPPSAATSVAESESSSDESENDQDSKKGALAALAKMQKTPVIKKHTERRTIKMLDMPTDAKNPAIERMNRREDARRTGLRLKPDISSLHRTLLSWNHDHAGPEPPGAKLALTRIPDRFSDTQHYRRVLEPLLLMECWAQIQQSKDEPQEAIQCNIVTRQYTDDWIDVDVSITEGVKKDWGLADTDIVLLKFPGTKRAYLGKIQHYRPTPMNLQATVRIMVGAGEPGPQANTVWQLSKVFSLTTLHREYAALMGLPYYDLCNAILQPALRRISTSDDSEIKRTMTAYNLNEPQAKAIVYSMQTDGFSLIQGPPGTGKTSTICGLVQTFLNKRPKPATAVYVGRSVAPADKEMPKKILLCAPSNAAIDEITFRLKEGVSGPGRQTISPKVVRVGATKSMNVSVKDVSLDHLIELKINADPDYKIAAKDAGGEISSLRAELESVKRLRMQKLDEVNSIHDNATKTLALEEEIKILNKKRIGLTNQLDKLRDKQRSDSRNHDAMTRRFRLEVLQEADVICATLAGSGHELLESFEFEMVVIDEAAQAIELSSLIPLKYRCNRCIMVGDPQQLPPTVISQEASKYGYNQSLFVRLQKQRPDAVHLLSIQYRMHPDISKLPSAVFYDGRLIDGPGMREKTQKPWHSHAKFGAYRFFNIAHGVESPGSGRSLVNKSEAEVAVALFNRLRLEYPTHDFDYKIGIVTMYRAQVYELRRTFEQRFGANILSIVDFNTVDGFQGQEKDIIILSCVRAGPGLQTVGFLADVRRMNVALTRAKSSVFILGNAATLERSDTTWRRIVGDARERSALTDATMTFFASPTASSSRLKTAKSTSKAAKTQSKTVNESIPQNLSTPQQMASQRVASGSSIPSSDKPSRTEVVTSAGPSLPPSAPDQQLEERKAQKRVADDQVDPRPSTVARIEDGAPPQPKPKPPFIKRSKQAANLFIPSKKRKP